VVDGNSDGIIVGSRMKVKNTDLLLLRIEGLILVWSHIGGWRMRNNAVV
jgi:hypothetical protein